MIMLNKSTFTRSFSVLPSLAAALSSLALLGNTANATLITYEGFSYGAILSQDDSVFVLPGSPNNGLGTLVPGDSFGWGAGWSTSAGTNQYMASGLSYISGATLFTEGGALRVGGVHPMVGTTTAQLQRQLGYDLGGAGTSNTLGAISANYGGTLWISFLYQNWVDDPLALATPGYASAYMAFMTNGTIGTDGSSGRNGQDIFGVGAGNSSTLGVPQGTVMGAIGANTGFVSLDPNATNYWGPNSAATLFVLRIEVDNTSANDTITLWENPFIGSGVGGLGTPTGTYSTNLSLVNGFRFQAGNNNGTRTNAVFVVDEFRLGSTFDDVVPLVPEPAMVAILGVGLSAMVVVMRRKRA